MLNFYLSNNKYTELPGRVSLQSAQIQFLLPIYFPTYHRVDRPRYSAISRGSNSHEIRDMCADLTAEFHSRSGSTRLDRINPDCIVEMKFTQ